QHDQGQEADEVPEPGVGEKGRRIVEHAESGEEDLDDDAYDEQRRRERVEQARDLAHDDSPNELGFLDPRTSASRKRYDLAAREGRIHRPTAGASRRPSPPRRS